METSELLDEKTHVSFEMPADLHRRLKVVAASENMTLKYILNGLVEAWVAKKEEAKEA